MKINSSRSSGIVVSSISSSLTSGASSSGSLLARFRSRRSRSMARLRAVVTSQPPGLAGIPVRAQRSAAIANASWVASSATSKSPRKPISVARTRPHSSRNTCSISVVAPQWATLDRAVHPDCGNARGQLDRGIEVVGLEEVVPAENLLRLGERPVRNQRLPVLTADSGRGLDALQTTAADDALVVAQSHVLACQRFAVLVAETVIGAGRLVDQQCVLHNFLLASFPFSATTNGYPRRGQPRRSCRYVRTRNAPRPG